MLGKTPTSRLIPPPYLCAGDSEAVEVFAGGRRLAVELVEGLLQKGHHGACSFELQAAKLTPTCQDCCYGPSAPAQPVPQSCHSDSVHVSVPACSTGRINCQSLLQVDNAFRKPMAGATATATTSVYHRYCLDGFAPTGLTKLNGCPWQAAG